MLNLGDITETKHFTLLLVEKKLLDCQLSVDILVVIVLDLYNFGLILAEEFGVLHDITD